MDLRTLAPQQLQSLNEQLESDIAALQDSMQTLSQAAMRFHKSGVALEELMKQEPGAELYVFFVNDTNFDRRPPVCREKNARAADKLAVRAGNPG